MTVDKIALSLAAYGPAAARFEVGGPLSSDDWGALLSVVRRERLSGLFVDALDNGHFPATPEQQQQAHALHVAMMTRVLLLDRLLLRVAGALRDADIEFRLLKGCAHAHLLYPDPSLRPYVDVDLLVRGAHFAKAVEVFGAHGINRPEPELRPGFDRRFGKGATLRTAQGDGIDLHRTFVDGPFAVMNDPDELFATVEFIEVGGFTLPTLGREERLLHACFHAAVSDRVPGLMALRDVVQASCDPALDVPRFRELAQRWNASAVVAKAVRTSFNRLAPDINGDLVAWSRAYQPGRREARIMRSYEANERRWARQAVAAVREVPGMGAKLAYARAVVMPTRQAMLARGRTRGSRLIRVPKILGRGENE